MIKNKQLTKCKRCKKNTQNLAVTFSAQYTICWDCLIELDINRKNFEKYEKKA